METFENVTLVFAGYGSAKKDENGQRTAKFLIGTTCDNDFGISNGIIVFAKTAKQIKKGAKQEFSRIGIIRNEAGYAWIKALVQ